MAAETVVSVPLPWVSSYDPYWWRHYDYVGVGESPPQAIAECEPCQVHAAPVNATYQCLSPLVGKTVLARRVEDGHFYLGQVKQELSRDRFLVIFDPSHGKVRSTNLQEVWIFDIIAYADAFRHPVGPGDKVLVPAGDNRFVPASVLHGSEHRSTQSPFKNANLVVSHLDGIVEKLKPNCSIWLPRNIFERLVFELGLPIETRRMLCNLKCDLQGECYPTECSGWPVCGQECSHIASDNPYQCSSYYRTLYKSWPWWWRYWYSQVPPSWISGKQYVYSPPAPQPPLVCVPEPKRGFQPLGRSHSASRVTCYEDRTLPRGPEVHHVRPDGPGSCFAELSGPDFVEVRQVGPDMQPRSRGTCYQYVEPTEVIRRSTRPEVVPVRSNAPCCECTAHVFDHEDDSYRATRRPFTSTGERYFRPPSPEFYNTEVNESSTRNLRQLLRKWQPPARRWLPTNKNQYGVNKPSNGTDYVRQDRALAEWERKGRPQSQTFPSHASSNSHPNNFEAMRAYCHCHCGHQF